MQAGVPTLAFTFLLVAATPSSLEGQDENGSEPLNVERECPDTPPLDPFRRILPGVDENTRPLDLIVRPRVAPTRASERGRREAVAALAARCRQQLLVEETRLFAEQVEALFNSSDLVDLDRQELIRKSRDLLGRTDRLVALVDYGTEPPTINITGLPDEDFRVRVRRLVVLSLRLIPNLLTLSGQDAYDLDLLNQVRDDLAITEALTRLLPESEF